MAGLDLDRGVRIRSHPSGMKVATYLDTPGEYLTERGEKLDPKFAEEAGFDVKKDAREALKQRKMAEFKAQLDEQMASEEEALALALSNDGEYDVRHVGGGQYAIFGKDGTRVTKGTMSKADIELLLGRKAPEIGARAVE